MQLCMQLCIATMHALQQAREMPEAWFKLHSALAVHSVNSNVAMASSSKGGRSRTTSKFGFDVTKPVKRGFLNKQGKTVQRFKNRFFVLYPGFLVYYDEETKWRRDYTRGDTLEVFFESRARVLYMFYSETLSGVRKMQICVSMSVTVLKVLPKPLLGQLLCFVLRAGLAPSS